MSRVFIIISYCKPKNGDLHCNARAQAGLA